MSLFFILIASARKAPSACICENHRQRIKSSKILIETLDRNLYFFLCPESIYKLDPARPEPFQQSRYLKAYI